eukprot:scaffold16542_cov152-Skeletonema_dohrnii-CCMP3373.AAC.3
MRHDNNTIISAVERARQVDLTLHHQQCVASRNSQAAGRSFCLPTGLLTWAGSGCMSPNYPHFEQSHMLMLMVMGALQPQYQQKQAAFNAVFRDAFMAPNVTEYHKSPQNLPCSWPRLQTNCLARRI